MLRILTLLSVLLYSIISSAQSLDDCSSFQVATVRAGTPTYSANLKDAVDDALPGDEILVGNGTYPKIRVRDKANLVIKSTCGSIVQSFVLKRSMNIVIDGFEITNTSDMKSGIYLGKDQNSNSFITIRNNKIHGETERSGLRVKNGNANVLIENNEIYGNENGIIVNRGDADDPITIKNNIIRDNNKNGILVKGNPIANIIGNTIQNNGLGGDSGNGYGIKKTKKGGRDRITLTGNIITNNNGTVDEGRWSQDLRNFNKILDPTDSNNITTTGTEGPGVSLEDITDPVISANISDNAQFSTTPVDLAVSVVDQTLKETSVFLNGTLVSTETSEFFTVSLDFIQGLNLVRIDSEDDFGNTATLNIVDIFVDSVEPVISLNIADGAEVSSLPFNLQVSVVESSLKDTKVLLNGVELNVSTDLSFNLDIPFEQGDNSLTVVSEDNLGGTSSVEITGINVDSVPPVVSTNLASGTTVMQVPFDLDVTVSDANINESVVFLNGNEVDRNSGGSFTNPLSFLQGTNSVSIVSSDTFGNTTTLNITEIFVDTEGPIINLNYADGDDIFFDQSRLVDFTINTNEFVSSITVNGIPAFGFFQDYTYSHESASGLESEQFAFVATDLYGNTTEKIINLNYTVDEDRPVINVTQTGDIFTNNPVFPLNISINDVGGTVTRVYLNGTQILESNLKTIASTASLSEGSNTIRVTSVDSAGNIAEPVVLREIRFDNQPLNITVSSPGEGSELIDGLASISGSSNKELNSVTVNGTQLVLSEDKLNFSGSYGFGSQTGELVLNFSATDLYGVNTNLSRPVFVKDIVRTNLAYITDSKEGKIHVYNSDDLSFVRDIEVDLVGLEPTNPGPNKGRLSNISISVDKKKAFVLQAANENIAVIDLESSEVVASNLLRLNSDVGVTNTDSLIPNKAIRVADNGLNVFFANAFSEGEDGVDPDVVGGLVVLDTQSNVFSKIDINGIEPESLELDASGSKIYMSTGKNSILVFDSSSNTVLETIEIAVPLLKSNNLVLSNDGGSIFVSSSSSNLIYRIDLSTKQLIQSIDLQGSQSGLIRTGTGSKIYALVNKNGTSVISVVDENSNTVSQEIPLGNVSSKFKKSLDSTKLWVTSEGSNAVKVVDLSSLSVSNTISVNSPLDVAFGYIDEKSEANIPPLASFIFLPKEQIAPATYSFDGSASKDLDGSISSYSWDIDGNSFSGQQVSYNFQTPGVYSASLTVVDSGGESRTKSLQINVGDRFAPPTPIFYSKAETDFGLFKISFDASRSFKVGGQINEYRWDFGDGTAGTGKNVTHEYSNAGTYLVTLVVEDSFGVQSSTTKSVSPSDVTPLNLSVISPRPGALFNTSSVTVQGSLDEISNLIKIDGQRVIQNADKSFSGEVLLTSQGVNVFSIEAVDNSGNIKVINLPIVYDSIVPTLSSLVPDGNSILYQKDGNIVASIDSSEPISSIKFDGEDVQVDNNAQRTFTKLISYGGSGVRTVSVIAEDLSGNTATADISFDLQIDSVEPVISFVDEPGAVVNQPSLAININVIDDSPVNTIIKLNDNVVQNNTVISLVSGENVITVASTDAAGNTSSVSRDVLFDNVPPSLQLSKEDGFITNQASLEIDSRVFDTGDTTSGLYLNGTLINSSTESLFSTTVNLNEGLNNLTLTSQDGAGNVSAAETINVTLDTAPPVLSNIRPATGLVVGIQTLALPVSVESNERLKSLLVNGVPLGVNIADIMFSDILQIFGDGQMDLTFQAIDMAGNETTFIHSIETALDNDDPVIMITGVADDQQVTIASMPVTIDIQDSSAVNVQLFLNDKFIFDSTDINFNYNIVLNEGVNNFKVVATDSVDRVAEKIISNIRLDSAGPVLNITSPTDGQEFETSSITVAFSSNEPMGQVLIDGTMYPLNGATTFNQTIELGRVGAVIVPIQVADAAGNITTADRSIYVQEPSSGPGGVIVSSDSRSQCVLSGDKLLCWGENDQAQVGDGTQVLRLSPVDVVGMDSGVTSVDNEQSYTCGIKNNKLYCWGFAGNQRIFTQSSSGFGPTLVPTEIIGMPENVSWFSGSRGTACIISDGAVKCWGNNFAGRLGIPTDINGNVNEPTIVPGVESNMVAVENAENNFTALTAGGVVKTWGRNFSGGLGDGTTVDRNTPSDVLGIAESVSQISAYDSTTCAVATGGKLYCWGANNAGQVGNGTRTNQLLPVVIFESGIKQVSVGEQYTCAVTTSGSGKCWGRNTRGQIGVGFLNGTFSTPQDVLTLDSGVESIVAGKSVACAAMESGSVKCWGGPASNFNQPSFLGDGTANPSTIPVDVIDLPTTGGMPTIIANISASPIRGKAPLNVSLMGNGSNSTNGAITGYSWELDGNVVSTTDSFTQNFPTAGQFPIKLTVTDSAGGTAERSIFIIVEDDLDAIPLFTQNLNIANGIVSVAFDAGASSDPDGSITAYNWDFGDSNMGSGETIVHQYSAEGNYNVTLTLTSDNGQQTNITKEVVVKDVVPPLLTITSPTTGTKTRKDFILTGVSNEKLQSLSLNGANVDLGVDMLSFSKSFSMNKSGFVTLELEAIDLANNKSKKQLVVEFDSIGPVLSGINPTENSVIYSQDGFVEIVAQSSEALSSATVNGRTMSISGSNSNEISGSIIVSNNELTEAEFIVFDTVGNRTVKRVKFRYEQDTSVPALTAEASESGPTKESAYSINISAIDNSLDKVEVLNDGVVISESTIGVFTYSGTLLSGDNNYSVRAIDKAGNVASIDLPLVTLDNTAPQIFISSPGSGDVLENAKFAVAGSVSEPLSSLVIGGKNISIDNDLTFEANIEALSTGDFGLGIAGIDLAGNLVNYELPLVFDLILVPNLISINTINGGDRLLVVGMDGSTKPNTEITISPGFFGSQSTVSDAQGAFSVEIKPFSSAKITATNGSQEVEDTLTYQLRTRLAGIIKSVSGQSLPGVRVGVSGRNSFTLTDVAGSFSIDNPPTGDQKLIIDASDLNTDQIKYSNVEVAINVSYNRENILEDEVFLAPLIIDGTETLITSGGGASVTHPNVPGTVLNVPSGVKATFPDGSNEGVVSILKTPASQAIVAVPSFARPNEIIHLEPSGLRFNGPVELVLPNTNSLEPGVELVIMSMDVDDGTWGVDGLAKVDPSGSFIKTKNGEGITHFSPKYAVPIGPVIRPYNKIGDRGISTLEGGHRTALNLPSFKALGSTIRPSLVYSSSWAKPTAVITNYIAMPEQKVVSSGAAVQVDDGFFRSPDIKKDYCVSGDDTSVDSCFEDYIEYWRYREDVKFLEAVKQTAWYEPKSIKAQFFISGLKSDEFGQDLDIERPQVDINDEATWGVLPNQTLISFGLDLVNQDNEYFRSGIYPAVTHYEIELEQMVISSRLVPSFELADPPSNRYLLGLVPTVKRTNTLQSNVLDKIVPSDVTSPVYVQNKRDSEVGTGWKIAGVKQITNPGSNRIVLEEDGGGIKLYTADFNISTLADLNGENINLARGVSFDNWPTAAVTREVAGESKEILTIDLSQESNVLNPYSGTLPKTTGFLRSAQLCPVGQRMKSPSHRYREFLWDYTVPRKIESLFMAGSGEIYATDANEHSLFSQNGATSSNLLQTLGAPPSQGDYANNNAETINSLCRANFSASCVRRNEVLDEKCDSFPQISKLKLYHKYVGHNRTNEFLAPTNVNSGQIPVPSTSSLNSPMGITGGNDGNLYIADYGNNRVVRFNRSSNTATVIAGNGNASDGGDGGLAISASLYHPRGLVFDSSGNLFVTTENGFIRKIDTSGVISTFAGVPLGSAGSLLEDSTDAEKVALGKPTGIIVNSDTQMMYVADTQLNRVIQIDMIKRRADLIGGSGEVCTVSNIGDGGSALNACLSRPTWLGFDSNNDIIVADSGNNRIRKIGFSAEVGLATTFSPTVNDNSVLAKKLDGSYERLRRNGTKDIFNAKGLHIETVDRVGRSFQFSYNGSDKIEEIRNSVNQVVQFNYSGDKVSSIDTPSGTTNLSYIGGELAEVSFPDGTSKSYAYDADGLMVEETNQRNFKRTYEYNKYNRLSKTILPDNTEILHRDHLEGTFEEQDGDVTAFSSLDNGDVFSSLTVAGDEVVRYDKDINGFVYTATDPSGKVTRTIRNLGGFPTKVIRPDESVLEMVYDDKTFDLLKTTDTLSNESLVYQYDVYGNIIREVDGTQAVDRVFDAGTGQLLSETANNGKSISLQYNSLGLISQTTENISGGEINSTNFEYDNFGNLTRKTNSFNEEAQYTHDLSGNPLSESLKNSSGTFVTTAFSYDQMNRRTSVTTPNSFSTTYEHSPTGKISLTRDHFGSETLYAYDMFDRLASRTNPNGEKAEYFYDEKGNLIREITAKGEQKNYVYNASNLMVRKEFPDDTVNYIYDERDKVVRMSNKNSVIEFEVDSLDRLKSESVTGSGDASSFPSSTISYAYTSNNQLQSFSSSSGQTVNYSYYDGGDLRSIQSASGNVFQYSYDGLGRISGLSYPGIEAEYAYTSKSVVTGISYKRFGAQVAFFDYVRNDNNAVTGVTSDRGAASYNYDSGNQLTGASRSFNEIRGPASLPQYANETFGYDSIGNRTADNFGSFTYDSKNQKLTESTKYTFTYDANGNQIKKVSKVDGTAVEYEYSSENQLIKVNFRPSDGSGVINKEVSYFYDALGRRMKKIVLDNSAPLDSRKSFTRQYVYEGDDVFLEYDESDLLASYAASPVKPDDVLGVNVTSDGVSQNMAPSAGNYIFLKDQAGSISHIADTNGNILQKTDYSSFGKVIRYSDGADNDITASPLFSFSYAFAGREMDSETGLYYNRARHFDPEIGRFIQVDSSGGNARNPSTVVNNYIYGVNNPLYYTDPSGKFIFTVGALVGAYFVGTATFTTFTTIVLTAATTAAFTGAVYEWSAVSQEGGVQNLDDLYESKAFWSNVGLSFAGGLAGGAVLSQFGLLQNGLFTGKALLNVSSLPNAIGAGALFGAVNSSTQLAILAASGQKISGSSALTLIGTSTLASGATVGLGFWFVPKATHLPVIIINTSEARVWQTVPLDDASSQGGQP